ncbi:hypothetical protein MMC19_007740, partial [Ptychographa xylographoides]|nr:hypothetical protein [Ptychographa xylographoides]
MSGASVTFGPGAVVEHVQIQTPSLPPLQWCRVSCQWYKPSCTALLLYESKEAASRALRVLRRVHQLDHRVKVHLYADEHHNTFGIQIVSVDILTAAESLASVVKRFTIPYISEELSAAMTTVSDEQAYFNVIEKFKEIGTLEDWDIVESNRYKIEVIARFSNMEEATSAVRALNGQPLSSLSRSRFKVRPFLSAKFRILKGVYSAIKHELTEGLQLLRKHGFLEFKAYPSTNPASDYTKFLLSGADQWIVGIASTMVLQILRGFTAMEGTAIIWDKFFLTPAGIRYLVQLGKEESVFIYRDIRNAHLVLYGTALHRLNVERVLANKQCELSQSTNILPDEDMPQRELHEDVHRLQEELRDVGVILNVSADEKIFTMQGPLQGSQTFEPIWTQQGVGNMKNEGMI